MKYLLDTNALIHLFNGNQPLTSKVLTQDPSDLAISGFTEAEINFGIENSSDEKRETNRAARNLALAAFNRIYHDQSISEAYGQIKAHLVKTKCFFPQNEIDIFIAATAVAKNLTLITQNTSDFKNIPGLILEDWSD